MCSETLVSESISLIRAPYLVVPGKLPRAEGWLHTYEMVTEHFAKENLSVVVAKCRFLVFLCVRQHLYVLSFFRNPDQDDRIFNF